ncbi:hypothetical protein BST61_g4688 [Cercospora zeina]
MAVPFSEASFARGLPNPLYNQSHLLWQKRLKAFLDEHYHPFASQWEEADSVPESHYQTLIRANVLVAAMTMPLPCDMLSSMGIHEILGIPIKDFDVLHGLILFDEIYRSGLTGPFSCISSFAVGLPYIFRHGSRGIRERYVPDVIRGKQKFAIAMSEAAVGSDAGQLETTAVKSADGKDYIINGEKKWITQGLVSDYVMLGARTGPPGSGSAGVSVIICPLVGPGISRERIVMSGQVTAYHAKITFKNARVPVSNLIGEEGKGLQYFVSNVNHERLLLAASAVRFARTALSTAFKYATERRAFGKTLLDQPVVRHRFAKAGAELEGYSAWVDQVGYQCSQLSEEEINKFCGGSICLLKAKGGMVFQECCSTAALVMGAVGYARNESGALIEKLWREVMGTRIPAGSEDVMLDQGINQYRRQYLAELKRAGGSSKL